MGVQGWISFGMLVLVWRLFGESPMADSCAIPEEPVELPEGDLIANRDFAVLTVSSGVCIGTFWTFCTVIGQLLLPLGYTEAQIGYLGFAFIASGVAGLLCAGPLMDKTKAFRELMLACAWAASVFSLLLLKVMVAANFLPLLLVCSALGFWLTAIQSVALETATEISYPAPEATSSGIILGAAVGIYCLFPFLVLRASARTVLLGQSALFSATSLLLTTAFRPVYRRVEYMKRCS